MVHAVETNLQRLLEGTKQYQVPLYQRTYSWRTEQLRRLWEDLVKLAEDRTERGAAATHFIGSLVLAPTPALGPTGVQQFLVVDGQQRLTTLTVLLTAIRDHRAVTEGAHHIDRINEKYLINKWEKDQPTKVLPTQADRAAYLACIHRTSHAGGSDSIGAAYRFFRARLTELDDPEDPLDVERLEEAVIGGLSLVCVTAQQGDNAHRIFESLNNTGLRLTQGDLIRNYLFMRLPTRGEHIYNTVWLPLQERLTSEQLELLFWLDLVHQDETAKQTDTYALQQARLDRLATEDDVAGEVARFAGLGELLMLILDPSLETNDAVRQQLTRLNAWGTTTTNSLLLYMLDRRVRGEATDDEVVGAMRSLESFFVRRVIIGKATANINRILLRAVHEIRDAPLDVALRRYLSTGRKFFASDPEIRAAVRTVPFYWSGKSHQKKLILQWIEEAHGSKEPIVATNLTIEHVLPQSLTDQWRETLGSNLDAGEDVDTVHQSIVHTIGNLTLTGYNSELSNSSFSSKRERLRASGLRMNQEIAGAATWDRDQILLRADRLAERIVELWAGPDLSAVPATEHAAWSQLALLLAAVPPGAWTTYGDVAAVLGTHPVPLGQRLANHPVVNAHRVLASGGVVSPNFRWLEADRTETARQVLEQEGVRFDDAGRAAPDQRLHAEDLAILAGIELEQAEQIEGDLPERKDSFDAQLAAMQSPKTVAALREVLSAWTQLGGWLGFGEGQETSCFLMGRSGRRELWPVTIYPSGKVEVVFQYLASRPPFDQVDLRHEFRERLNRIDGVNLSAARIELRPGFSVALLDDQGSRDTFIEQLSWFMSEIQRYSAGEAEA